VQLFKIEGAGDEIICSGQICCLNLFRLALERDQDHMGLCHQVDGTNPAARFKARHSGQIPVKQAQIKAACVYGSACLLAVGHGHYFKTPGLHHIPEIPDGLTSAEQYA
jgi:hypothetical protein